MNLHHLRIFLVVAETGSISAGAERLHISQPAVTREIRELEESLGQRLFDRQPRGVRLTESGQRLLHYAQRIFNLEQAAERDLSDFAQLEQGELRLGASATLGAYLLPPLIGRFRQRHPQVFVSLAMDNTTGVTRQLDDGLISLGLVEGPFARDAYAHRLLAQDPLLPVVAAHHPLAAAKRLPASSLQDYPLYLREPGSGTRNSIEQAYRSHGLEPRAHMAIGSTEALKRLLLDGQGIAWLSGHALERELSSGELRQLAVFDLRIERDFHVLWRQGVSLSPAPSAFLALNGISP
ncbi:LysR family transcriptional regulator [Stutzerimonas kirkiae]|uniref:LysR family transcriptional regulator n=1 Tax=Stutzerimonas kirkiae TaxID=2211392 RepID=A0A4Q9QXB3_9GAMM|nr:LysR family transcriptional regulator [Stutzerimonas kirkiae]TBU89276.1 LysR family transcriptional regulator [Stutzerimonas kirkiae]TBU99682.1 LysR family transcriptional regulator [Stutzerimonas kirkiae]